MPYISQENRDKIAPVLDPLLEQIELGEINGPGEINYIITKILLARILKRPVYCDFNEVVGILECVRQEFYRRLVTIYEDGKIELNGDVY